MKGNAKVQPLGLTSSSAPSSLDRAFVLTGVFIIADDVTLNSRIYSKQVLQLAVREYMQRIEDQPRLALGEVRRTSLHIIQSCPIRFEGEKVLSQTFKLKFVL